MVDKGHTKLSMRRQCQLLGVARSSVEYEAVPDLAAGFAGIGRSRMPEDLDRSVGGGGDGPSAVETVGGGDEVALGFERRASVGRACVEHGRADKLDLRRRSPGVGKQGEDKADGGFHGVKRMDSENVAFRRLALSGEGGPDYCDSAPRPAHASARQGGEIFRKG